MTHGTVTSHSVWSGINSLPENHGFAGLALPITLCIIEKIKLMKQVMSGVLLSGWGSYCWAGDSGTQGHISGAQEAQMGIVGRVW